MSTTTAGRGAALFPGLLILVLFLAWLFMRGRDGDDSPAFNRESYRKGALYFLVLMLVALVLSLGPKIGGVSNPFYLISYNLGILKFTRTPMRFYILVVLGMAVLAGYGTAKVAARVRNLRAGRLIAAGIAVLLVVELASFNLPVYEIPVGDSVPEVYSWLEEREEAKLIELPVNMSPRNASFYRHDWEMEYEWADIQGILEESLSMYFSTYNWKKIVNGFSGYFPYFYIRILSEMQAFPSRRSLDLLMGLDIDYVIWHWNRVDESERPELEALFTATAGMSQVEDFGSISVYYIPPGEVASPDDLRVDIQAPEAAPSGEPFTMCLTVRNTSDKPFVLAEEDPQEYRLDLYDRSGNTAFRKNGEYRAPFFIEAGEETELPLEIEGVPQIGPYRLELALGGILGDRSFSSEIDIEKPSVLAGTGNLDGSITVKNQPDVL
ncbi:MAG: hypothetical protein SWK76_12715 [Actinomycetota bacterium]|nr:hypothetical protein [Actinomycetota bacterium]